MDGVPLVVALPDKYRGTLSALEAARAIERAAVAAGWLCRSAPVSDGGEGFVDAIAGPGAGPRRTVVRGPLGAPTKAEWAVVSSPVAGRSTAVIESAQAAGLMLVGGPQGNDAVRASTHGVGQLVAAAFGEGVSQVLVGVGGSATTDGGLGALDALGRHARRFPAEVVVACDVTTRFVDAAAVFAPQKGATPAEVQLLGRRLERLADLYRERYGVDVNALPGSGAAGGLAGGLAAAGASLVPGFDVVAEHHGLAELVATADLVVTGEGYLDAQSFEGKAVGGVCRLAERAGVPVVVVAGDGDEELLGAPGRVSLVRTFGDQRARQATADCLVSVVGDLLGRARPA